MLTTMTVIGMSKGRPKPHKTKLFSFAIFMNGIIWSFENALLRIFFQSFDSFPPFFSRLVKFASSAAVTANSVPSSATPTSNLMYPFSNWSVNHRWLGSRHLSARLWIRMLLRPRKWHCPMKWHYSNGPSRGREKSYTSHIQTELCRVARGSRRGSDHWRKWHCDYICICWLRHDFFRCMSGGRASCFASALFHWCSISLVLFSSTHMRVSMLDDDRFDPIWGPSNVFRSFALSLLLLDSRFINFVHT